MSLPILMLCLDAEQSSEMLAQKVICFIVSRKFRSPNGGVLADTIDTGAARA
jgi:hypothetical protein